MALQVWLPLNGTLENRGLCPLVPSGTPTYLDDGKFGQCISLTPRVSFSKMIEMKKFTILFWLRVDSCSTDWADSLSFTTYKADGVTSGTVFRFEATKTSRACSFHNNADYSITQGSRILITSAQYGEWHHCGFSYDGTNCYTYIDGVKTYTDAGLGGSIYNYFHIGETNAMVGGMNDLRIYDECLSDKQIKDVSLGLLLHYKLDTIRPLNNLKRNAAYSPYNNYSSSGSTATVVKTGEIFEGAEVYRLTYTPNDTSLAHVQSTLHGHGVYTASSTYTANTKYCFWTLCKPISHPDTIIGGVASNIGGWTEIPMKEYDRGWYIVGQYRNGTVTTDKTDSIFTSFKTPSATSGTPIIIDFCCPHLVSGYDYIVPENNYAGTTQAYEIDYSGNKYNGPLYGTLLYDNNTSRYLASTKFNSGYIHKIPSPLTSDSDAFTISCWFYPTQNATMCLINDRTAVGDGLALFYYSGGIRFDTGSSYQWQVGSITLNAWNFIAATWNKKEGTKKLYINGSLINTTTSYGTLAQIGSLFSIGNSSTNGAAGAGNQIYGNLSDFRIYGTALSNNDILNLYHTGCIIDNKQNVNTYELIEDGGTLAYSDVISAHSNFYDTFTRTVVDDSESPSGKATKLTCTAVGTQTSRGYYIPGTATPWSTARSKMENGKQYELSMYVKMNKATSNFKMNVECGTSQSQTTFNVGTTYKRIANTFTYNASATYVAITNYATIFEVNDEIYIHSFKVTEVPNLKPKIYKSGILDSSNFDEDEKVKLYKSSVEANEFIEI